MKIKHLLALLLLALGTIFARAEEEAMKPFYGTWDVDAEATAKENSSLNAQFVSGMKKDLAANPITLIINEKEYISKSPLRMRTDAYRVADTKDGHVTLALLGAGDEDEGRRATLFERNGAMFLRFGETHIVMVFRHHPEAKTGKGK